MASEKALFRPMTNEEKRAIEAFQAVRFPVASAAKRAARILTAQLGRGEITDKQAVGLLWPMIARFRKQIADKELVAYSAKAMGMSILRSDQ